MKSKSKNILFYTLPVLIIIGLIIITDSYSRNTTRRSSEDCFACHDDKDLTMEKNGKTISIYVNPKIYESSVHSIAECTDCHEDYNPEELPHTPIKKDVNCISCHNEAKNIEKNLHSNVKCYDCHSKHDIKAAKEFAKQQTQNCLSCHNKKDIRQFSSSIHDKKGIGCEGCHNGGHSVIKIKNQDVTSTCGKCHQPHRVSFSNSIHQTVFSEGNKNAPNCVSCHGSHRIVSSQMAIESESCLKCHLDEKKFPGDEKGSANFIKQYQTSIHNIIKKNGKDAAGCVDCHGNHMIEKGSDPRSTVSRENIIETCGNCHKETVEKFKKSKHGIELMKGNKDAPTCSDCHGDHDIKSTLIVDDKSKLLMAEKCLNCHQDNKLPFKHGKEGEVTQDYKKSVHYLELLKGNYEAPSCYDCHGAHEMENANEPHSKLNRMNIAQTCGTSECHKDQYDEFKGSAHDQGVMNVDNEDAPTCNTCHGDHVIFSLEEKDNPLSNPKGIVKVCSDCHASDNLNVKYDLLGDRVKTFEKSIHGIYVSFGNVRAANCQSCHTNHNVRKQNDPLSSVNPANIAETCGQSECHTNVTPEFVKGRIHLDASSKDSGIIYYIAKAFLFFTVAILGSLILYIILDFITRIRERMAKRRIS